MSTVYKITGLTFLNRKNSNKHIEDTLVDGEMVINTVVDDITGVQNKVPWFLITEVLKWKPAEMYSVDFKLRIVKEGGLGLLTKTVGHLYVGGMDTPFSQMKVKGELILQTDSSASLASNRP